MTDKRKTLFYCICLLLVSGLFFTSPAPGRMITDGIGRQMEVPLKVEHVICSGPGTLRLLTYLQAQDSIVAVDDMEKRRPQFDARPYALAHPEFKSYPVFGEFRGHDNPELILTLSPLPQVIFKTRFASGHDPIELSQKTGIPVVILNYGDLRKHRQDFYQSLRIMGQVMGREERAQAVINFFESHITDLKQRTADIPENSRPTCFVGGIAYRGPHGYQSTEPNYPPFALAGARNLADGPLKADSTLQYSSIAKEKIIVWDPDILFLDLSTLQMGDKSGGLYELKTDIAYQGLTAVQSGKVYGVLPYNWYTQNFGSIIANAYFVGKLLYPKKFPDIDPVIMADKIYSFLVGKPVFQQLNSAFQNFAFQSVPIK